MKPTDRSFLEEDEEDMEEDREDFLGWITAGMVCWRDIMEGILVVVFLRIDRGKVAVVLVDAKIREGGMAVTRTEMWYVVSMTLVELSRIESGRREMRRCFMLVGDNVVDMDNRECGSGRV
jgi:hypothetical protein